MNIDFALILNPFLLSLKTISVSAILFIAIGIPIAYLLAKENLKFKWLLNTIVTLPLIFPPIAIGFFLLLLFRKFFL